MEGVQQDQTQSATNYCHRQSQVCDCHIPELVKDWQELYSDGRLCVAVDDEEKGEEVDEVEIEPPLLKVVLVHVGLHKHS